MDLAEIDEITDHVLLRLSEMSEADKKARAIVNRDILRDAAKDQSKRMRQFMNDHCDGRGDYVDYPHMWRAIYEINKLVPWIIGVRYSNWENESNFYEAHPENKIVRNHLSTVPNQMLPGDKKLAEQISRELTDILFKYIDPKGWSEDGEQTREKNLHYYRKEDQGVETRPEGG